MKGLWNTCTWQLFACSYDVWQARLLVIHPGCVGLDFSTVAMRMTLIESDGRRRAEWSQQYKLIEVKGLEV